MFLTLSKARCATPQIFAVTPSEYKYARVFLSVGFNSRASEAGGVTNPNSSLVNGSCFGSRAICYRNVNQGCNFEKLRERQTVASVQSLRLEAIALSSLGGDKARFFDFRMVIDWKQFWNREMKELEEDDMMKPKSRPAHYLHRH
jgi:hypothetical protein